MPDIDRPDEEDNDTTVYYDPIAEEIEDAREDMEVRLHSAYLNLMADLEPFQDAWNEDPAGALMQAHGHSLHTSEAGWIGRGADAFDAATWRDLGRTIGASNGEAMDDAAADDDFIWWRRSFERREEGALRKWAASSAGKPSARDASDAVVLVDNERRAKLHRHCDAILRLPTLIANRDVRALEAFLRDVVRDIDEEVHDDIRASEPWEVVGAVLDCEDVAPTFAAYVSMMVDAIPPHVLVLLAGPSAVYLLLEAVLLVGAALLDLGWVAGGRIDELVERLNLAKEQLDEEGNEDDEALAAVIDAFIRQLEDVSRVINRLHRLGSTLHDERGAAGRDHAEGKDEGDLKAARRGIKQDTRCRHCGSTEHGTSRDRPGTVDYE